VESVPYVRWAANSKRLGLRSGDVGLTVMALATEAVRAKTKTGAASINDFNWFALAVYFGTDASWLNTIGG
jgi:hypothetical protein